MRTEPDPAGGTLTTTYSYDWMKHLTGVNMTRGSVTQTRTFVYDDLGHMTSATNPESGTVAYYYNADNTLWYKHDAKGQDTVYTYDAKKRPTMLQQYPTGKNNAEDTCQRLMYTYDSSAYSQNGQGRLVSVQYSVCAPGHNKQVTEYYGYHPAGTVVARAFQTTVCGTDGEGHYGCPTASAGVGYTLDSKGAVSAVTYPGQTGQYVYGSDWAGRHVSLSHAETQPYVGTVTSMLVQNGQFDVAGRLTSLQFRVGQVGHTAYDYESDSYFTAYANAYETETRGYNTMGQLTSLGWASNAVTDSYGGPYTNTFAFDKSLTYSYPGPGANNGQLDSMSDGTGGETVTYQYDSLKRLIQASATPNTGSSTAAWTQSYGLDGFGNLTSKTLNGTQSPIPVDGATNRLSSAAYYDANGNMTSGAGATLVYDVANRLTAAQTTNNATVWEYYGYAPDNKRVFRVKPDGSEEWTLFGARGEKLGVYVTSGPQATYNSQGQWTGQTASFTAVKVNVWFDGRLVTEAGTAVYQDRLGTNRASGARFYPYGEEISSTANDRVKFGTYTRDDLTKLDYADQRFYASGYGRFMTYDPGYAGTLSDPRSLNLYSYVLGDPVNGNDPEGLCSVMGSGITQSAYSGSTSGQQDFANEVGGISVMPYSNGSLLGGVANVIVQGMGVPTGATATWLNAISVAAQTPGPISIYAFSGSGGAFTNAYNWLTPEVQARITNITYIDPGNFSQPLATGMPGTNVSLYTDNSDVENLAVQLFGSGPTGTVNIVNTNTCGHNENCVYTNFADQLSKTATNCTVGAGAVFGLPARNYSYSSGFSLYNFFWAEPAPVPSVTTTIRYFLP